MNVQTTAIVDTTNASAAGSPAQMGRQALPSAFDPSDELLTVLEAASCLKVCRRTVYNLLTEGRLRAFYVGKQRRIPRAELLKYLGGASAVVSAASVGAVHE